VVQNFQQLLDAALRLAPKRVALAAAHDEAALSALVEGRRRGLARGRLFGDQDAISRLLEKLGATSEEFLEVFHAPEPELAAREAVKSVRDGKADLLLKGKIHTATFLKAVLDPERGLRTGRLLSDHFVFENPRREGSQLVIITDGGVNLLPNLQQKIQILRNAVELAHKLGNPNPKVAILSAVETIIPDLPSTTDAAVLTVMNQRGQITDCVVDGPFALDNAVSLQAAQLKGIDSPVAGRADILLCPSIEAANLLAKSVIYFAGFRSAHVILGASAPVLIPSRADTAETKLLSIALGVMACSERDN